MLSAARLFALGAVAACAPVGDEGRTVPDEPSEAPTDTDLPGGGHPAMAEEEVRALEDALERFADWVPRLDVGRAMQELLADLDALSDRDCPDHGALDGVSDIETCTTEDGVRIYGGHVVRRGGWEGVAAGIREEILDSLLPAVEPGWTAASVPTRVDGTQVYGILVVEPPSDWSRANLELSGDFLDLALESPTLVARVRQLEGPVLYEAATPADWVAAGLAPYLRTGWMRGPLGTRVVLQGSLSGLPDPPSVFSTGFLDMDTTRCASEPAGTIAVRTSSGGWMDVVFEGGDACDGCAAVRVGDVEVGTVCPNLSSLLDPPTPLVLVGR